MHSLGEAGEIEPETESILHELEIDDSEFPSHVLECLPAEQPWKIPQVCLTCCLCGECVALSCNMLCAGGRAEETRLPWGVCGVH